MSTTQAQEPTQNDTIAKLLADLDNRLDDLYARCDHLDATLSAMSLALKKIRRKKNKEIDAQLQQLMAEVNVNPPGYGYLFGLIMSMLFADLVASLCSHAHPHHVLPAAALDDD
ncbi:hypothetical protein FZEAL_4745 [Fusarium zealandicum]|uniref:Uncharacterized protein n=1 Tax=Fusarium zealandicum TaxID=1053134 RepID=A0A8H4UL36_9HYPO|nr:hypothetical protein FZEAL_4745 [Fusarium zealandicum]